MLPVVLLAMFMAGFDIWVVNVAAPSLQRDLHVSDAALQLIVGGYAFMYAAGMVTGGRLGDLFGYRRLFLAGVVAFVVASLLCGVSQTLGRDEGWPVWTWISLAAALPGLALTLAWERRLSARGGEPLLGLDLFRDRAFSVGLLLNFVVIFFFGSFMFVLTLLLQSGLGNSPLHAGIDNLPLAVMFMGFCLLGPRLN